MSQAELLAFVARIFKSLDIKWMLVGSHASSFYGEARSTHDIDLVVDIPLAKIPDLLSAVPSDRYYLSEIALREGRMANLIDTLSGDKVDLFLVSGDPRMSEQLTRCRPCEMLGVRAYIASVEDTICSKLDWLRQLGGSERQVRDIRGILSKRAHAIEMGDLFEQIEKRNLVEVWVEHIGPWSQNNTGP